MQEKEIRSKPLAFSLEEAASLTLRVLETQERIAVFHLNPVNCCRIPLSSTGQSLRDGTWPTCSTEGDRFPSSPHI